MPTLSIDVTVEQAQRIQQALGSWLNLDRPATPLEVKAFIIARIQELVLKQERRAAEEARENIKQMEIT